MLKKSAVIALATTLLALVFPGEGKASLEEEIDCLALNIYFEARGEPIDGQIAVGHVVLNRVADSRYPNKICEVVKQGGPKPKHKCQFSWWCDGRSDRPRDVKAWKESQELARVIFWGYSEDPTGGALWYHADYTHPAWGRKLARGPKIGRHHFYLPGPMFAQTGPKLTGEKLTTAIRVAKKGVDERGDHDKVTDGGSAI